MASITGLTRDGQVWTPKFAISINMDSCIGCGRCFKVCVMDVLAYEEVDEDDSAKAYMTVNKPGNCIGCQACGRTCQKKCFKFEAASL